MAHFFVAFLAKKSNLKMAGSRAHKDLQSLSTLSVLRARKPKRFNFLLAFFSLKIPVYTAFF